MQKFVPPLAFLVAVAMLVGHQNYLQPWTLDDAYITFRYSRNFAEGHGAVFNPGERVEGYTSFLWMAMLAGAHKAGFDIIIAAKALGGGLTVATYALMASAHRWIRGVDWRVSSIAVALTGTIGLTSRWSMSGMEVPLVVFFIVLGMGLHLRERGGDDAPWLPVASGVVAALAFLSRPDAGLLFGAIFLDRLLIQRQFDRRFMAFMLPFFVIGGGWWAARWGWYGWPLPNTFYVKVGHSSAQLMRGFEYVGRFLMPGWLLIAAFVMSVWRGRYNERNPGLWALVIFVVMHVFYVLLVGGDVFWGWRFMTVIAPLMALTGALVWVDELDSRGHTRILWAGAVIGVCIQIGYTTQSSMLNHRGWVARTGVMVGQFLHDHAPEDALLAANIAGSVPYFSKLRVIDTLGLNDAHIAHVDVPSMGKGRAGHEKGDGRYVLRRSPDYILMGSSLGGKKPRFRGDRQLMAADEFHLKYRYEKYKLSAKRNIGLWVRRPEFGGRPLEGVQPYAWVEDVRNYKAGPADDEPEQDPALEGAP